MTKRKSYSIRLIARFDQYSFFFLPPTHAAESHGITSRRTSAYYSKDISYFYFLT